MPEMEDDPQAALDALLEGVRALLQNEDLAYADPAERAIVARLAVLLEGRFPGWTISVEWNRREDKIKRLALDVSDDELMEYGLIVPDLIVHRVGRRENLLLVEVKKAGNTDYVGDVWKLRSMTDPNGDYGYSVGLHLVLDVRRSAVTRCDVYRHGDPNDELTAWIRERLPSG